MVASWNMHCDISCKTQRQISILKQAVQNSHKTWDQLLETCIIPANFESFEPMRLNSQWKLHAKCYWDQTGLKQKQVNVSYTSQILYVLQVTELTTETNTTKGTVCQRGRILCGSILVLKPHTYHKSMNIETKSKAILNKKHSTRWDKGKRYCSKLTDDEQS